MYLLEGFPAPDHATFARFRSIHFAPCAKRILAEMSNTLFGLGETSGKSIFIDGTKIEACANKYTFVWKKAVTKNQAKLLVKIAGLIAECEQLYAIKIVYGDTVKMKHVKRLRKKLYALKQKENIEFVHGIGKRKSPLQKSIETLEEYLDRLKSYTQKLHICGNRNSFSKTDHDATFMRMKEDAMGNGQLKPAFNLQHGVDSEYITLLSIGPQPTDTTTLILFLKDAEMHLKFKYSKIVADAGYESEENYLFWTRMGRQHLSSQRTTKFPRAENIKRISAGWKTWNTMQIGIPTLAKTEKSCHFPISAVQNPKPDMSVKKTSISAVIVKNVLTKVNVSRGTTVKRR